MFESIKIGLLKPYPFVETTKQKVVTSLIFGKIIFLFFYLFKPFSISNFSNSLVRNSFNFGLITFLISLLLFVLLPLIFPTFFKFSKWNVGRMILTYLFLSIVITIANWFFITNNFSVETTWQHNFFTFSIRSFLLWFLPLLVYVFLKERKVNKRHTLVAQKLNRFTKTKLQKSNTEISLKTKAKPINVFINDITYISTNQKRTSIYYLKDGKIQQDSIEIAINELVDQFAAFDNMIQCHPSFIINTDKVKMIQGDARGYFLQLKAIDFLIPVSSSFPQEFLFTLVS